MNATWLTVRGVHVPKYNFTFLRRFGDVYHYRRPLEASDPPELRLPSHVELARWHDLADVIVLNFGLHAGNKSAYRHVMASALDDLERFGQQPGKAAVIRETSAQHFPAPSGDYLDAIRKDPALVRAEGPASVSPTVQQQQRKQRGGSGQPQLHWTGPSMCRQIAANAPKHWRNAVIADLLAERRHPHVGMQPFEELTRPRWDLHSVAKRVGNGWKSDCTHWCWSPCFWELSFHDLHQTLAPLLLRGARASGNRISRAREQGQPSIP